MDEVPDPYVQLSVIRIVRDGKEYVLLSNANGPGTQRWTVISVWQRSVRTAV
ncbi:exo-alpha-sialidase [Streptococcus suis]|nr:exo-alpha-sialidase [Streptococcus suis]